LNPMSYTQTMKDILHFTDDEVSESIQQQLIEKKLTWRLKELTTNGMFNEPDPESKKMMGMDKENDIFANLVFESDDVKKKVKNIITEQVDREIAVLLRATKAKATPKMIDQITNREYNFDNKFSNKIQTNIKKTEKDLI